MALREVLLGLLVRGDADAAALTAEAGAGLAAGRPLTPRSVDAALERLEREELVHRRDDGRWEATRAGHRELFAWLRRGGRGDTALRGTEFVEHPLVQVRFLDLLERPEQFALIDALSDDVRTNLTTLRAMRAAGGGEHLGPHGEMLLSLAISERELRLRHLRRLRESVGRSPSLARVTAS